ncbi:MAG: hypothetical protein DI536_24315 [Archangium gephyra]|uniref:Uncharacterized protein n=1 Tax=Archangium gephyra TaxID=48 RepID=A0A2W5VEP8_9BACT|nr:MAG: hypothetical protein DI536_24315 [Archangium gephyra]
MDIVELQGTPGNRLGHLGPLLVVVANTNPDLEDLDAVAVAQRQLIATYGYFAMALFSMKTPRASGPEVLDRIRRNEEELRGKSLGTVMVVLQRGLAASLSRTFMAATTLVASNPTYVEKNIEEAADKVKAMQGMPPEITGDADLVTKLTAFIAGAK